LRAVDEDFVKEFHQAPALYNMLEEVSEIRAEMLAIAFQ